MKLGGWATAGLLCLFALICNHTGKLLGVMMDLRSPIKLRDGPHSHTIVGFSDLARVALGKGFCPHPEAPPLLLVQTLNAQYSLAADFPTDQFPFLLVASITCVRMPQHALWCDLAIRSSKPRR